MESLGLGSMLTRESLHMPWITAEVVAPICSGAAVWLLGCSKVFMERADIVFSYLCKILSPCVLLVFTKIMKIGSVNSCNLLFLSAEEIILSFTQSSNEFINRNWYNRL